MKTNQLNLKKITLNKLIIIYCFMCCFGCNSNPDQKEKSKRLNIMTSEESSQYLFNYLKEGSIYNPDSIISFEINTNKAFPLLMKAFYYFGKDSLEKSDYYLEQFLLFDTTFCAQMIVNDFRQIIKDNHDLPVGYKDDFLQLYLNNLEYNSMDKICSFQFDTLEKTYNVTFELNE